MGIKKTLDDHELWVLTGGKAGARANLAGANLSVADLRYAYLTDANFHGANLRYADLGGAYLRGADFYGADLRGAYFRDANLRGANLSGAYLYGANLSGAYLYGADLSGAYLSDAYLGDAYLSGARGIIQWQAPQGERRICYSVKYDYGVMHKLGCFWGSTDEAVEAIRNKYGMGSLYEQFLLMQVQALEGK
jgi:hypothetical protein